MKTTSKSTVPLLPTEVLLPESWCQEAAAPCQEAAAPWQAAGGDEQELEAGA